jgi:hypothetical protein
MTATTAQIAYLNRLARQHGFTGPVEAADEYGLGLRGPGSLSKSEASELIDYLLVSPAEREARRAAFAATAEQNRQADADRRAAEAAREAARHRAMAADTAAMDALLQERGQGHLLGAERREARRLLRRELEAKGA